MKVMMIDDEASMRQVVSTLMRANGHQFIGLVDGNEAIATAFSQNPDVILLDVMLPGEDGFSICSRMRAAGIDTPIIFLSAKGDIVDKRIGFDAGGDDYFAKPFDPQELLLHIKAFVRRSQHATVVSNEKVAAGILRRGAFAFDSVRHSVEKNGIDLEFTPKEFAILFTLACNEGEVVSQQQLIESAWGENYVGETTGLAVYIRRIRKKIEADPSSPQTLQTCWGAGYVFKS